MKKDMRGPWKAGTVIMLSQHIGGKYVEAVKKRLFVL